MNKTPEISVIMPVYNAELFLDKAIKSILEQSFKNFEFIIINDGSTDTSLEIIQRYKKIDNRIILINRENKGLIHSLNEGIENSKGEYIARMDADDISLSNRFEEQIKLIKKDNADICGSHFFIINEEDEFIDAFIVPMKKRSFLNYLCITTPFAHPSVMLKKSFLTQNNIQYGQTIYQNAEDYALWVQFWNLDANFINVNAFLFKYRDVKKSLSSEKQKQIVREKRKISKEMVLNNHKKLLLNYESMDLTILSKMEQKLIAVSLMILIKYRFSLKYVKILLKINKSSMLLGIIQFFRVWY